MTFKRKLMNDQVKVSCICIGTEILGEEMRNVSTIEITLTKN